MIGRLAKICQKVEKVQPVFVKSASGPPRGIRAKDPNKWETEIGLHLIKLSKKKNSKLSCTWKSLSERAGCQEGTSGAGGLSLKTSSKNERFRVNAGGIMRQGMEEGFL